MSSVFGNFNRNQCQNVLNTEKVSITVLFLERTDYEDKN